MTQTLTDRTLHGVAWLGGASVLRLVLRVVSVALLARLLTPQEYGIAAAALVAAELGSMVYSIGIAPALIQRKNLTGDQIATAMTTSLVLAVIAAIGMWAGAPLIADAMRIPELVDVVRILSLITPLGAFNMICEALLARNLQSRTIALRPLLSFSIAAFGVGLPLAFIGYGYWALVSMQMAEVLVGTLTLAMAARRFLVAPSFHPRAIAELWPMSVGFSINQVFSYLVTNADQFVIARMLGVDALGLYSRASFLVKNASSLFGNISRATVFPAMAQVQGDLVRLRRATIRQISLTATAILPASAFCAVFSEEIVRILLGRNWDTAIVPFGLLALSLYPRLSRRGNYVAFQALGRPYIITTLQACNAALIALASIAAVPFGLHAVCLAVATATTMTMLLIFRSLVKVVGVTAHDIVASHVRPLCVTAGVVVIGLAVKTASAGYPEIVTALAGFGACFVPFIFILWTRPHWIIDDHARGVLLKIKIKPWI